LYVNNGHRDNYLSEPEFPLRLRLRLRLLTCSLKGRRSFVLVQLFVNKVVR